MLLIGFLCPPFSQDTTLPLVLSAAGFLKDISSHFSSLERSHFSFLGSIVTDLGRIVLKIGVHRFWLRIKGFL